MCNYTHIYVCIHAYAYIYIYIYTYVLGKGSKHGNSRVGIVGLPPESHRLR